MILEAEEQAVGSWPKYYDSLTLFSPARYSSLPDLQISGDLNRYPTKDEVIYYLNQYAERFRLNIRTKQRVLDIQKKVIYLKLTQLMGTFIIQRRLFQLLGLLIPRVFLK